jgi:hypothetical protein
MFVVRITRDRQMYFDGRLQWFLTLKHASSVWFPVSIAAVSLFVLSDSENWHIHSTYLAPGRSWFLVLFFSVITTSAWLQRGGVNMHVIDWGWLLLQSVLLRCAANNTMAKSWAVTVTNTSSILKEHIQYSAQECPSRFSPQFVLESVMPQGIPFLSSAFLLFTRLSLSVIWADMRPHQLGKRRAQISDLGSHYPELAFSQSLSLTRVCLKIITAKITKILADLSPFSLIWISQQLGKKGPPLWSSGQSSWLQIRRPGFDSRH